jgi:Asp-tRNA(Asn)/Glu-tRNA(Gln) amidotransferase A subunit family amidase
VRHLRIQANGLQKTVSQGKSRPQRIRSTAEPIQGIKIGDIDPCFGFLGRNISDIAWLCSKTIGKTITPYDPILYGGEWDTARYEAAKRKQLTVGYLYHNHEMKVAPGIINTIDETVEALRANKHKVVEFDFPQLHLFRDFFFEYVFVSGFLNGMFHRMEGHHPNSQAAEFYDLHLFGRLAAWYKTNRGICNVEKEVLKMYHKTPSRKEFFKIHNEIDKVRKIFLKQWHEKGVDVLLTPVMPFTATLPGTTDLLVYQLTYCCFQNVLELPAGSIPTRVVREEETKYEPSNAFEQKVAPAIWGSKGLPLAVQVTGKHMGDEECLGAMWQINKLVGNYLEPSFGKPKQTH